MLNKLINKLEHAKGQSEYVICVVVDIRGFSSFCNTRQAPDIGTFIAKFYIAILRKYFSNAAYAKPTGDGLLMLFRFTEQDLQKVAERIVTSCLKAIKEYPSLLLNDPMITFEMPGQIGFGIARGTAFCLYSGREVIDYSGPVLNLATRLNDFARPNGIVIDGAFKIEQLLSKETQLNFVRNDKVYIRGIAESAPTVICHSKGVILSPEVSIPIHIDEWKEFSQKLTYAQIKKLVGSNYNVVLPSAPASQNKIKAALVYSHPDLENHILTKALDIHAFTNDARGPRVTFEGSAIVQKLKDQKLTTKSIVAISIQYVPKVKN
ncbi:MAG TPA: adenylate/guanylate cyclase domain-containing protein [Gallionellaceae bacterium]